MLTPALLKQKIEEVLPGAEVEVTDTTGEGNHFRARVIAEVFAGMSRIERHRRVYAPFRDLFASGTLHALALETYAPAEWRNERSGTSGGTR